MIPEKEYQKKILELREEMGGKLALIARTCYIDEDIFCSYLATELKFKRSRRAKKADTIKKYLTDKIAKEYLLNNFEVLFKGVQNAVQKYIKDNPDQRNTKKAWDNHHEILLIGLIRIFDRARQLEFTKNKGIDPCNDPQILLLEFAFGSFPEEYVMPPYFYDSRLITKEQADMMRKELYPYVNIFFKAALNTTDEFANYNAKLLAFCFGIWPEKTTDEIALDYEHISELRFALRQHSHWLLETFGNELPRTPSLPEKNSPSDRFKIECLLSGHPVDDNDKKMLDYVFNNKTDT